MNFAHFSADLRLTNKRMRISNQVDITQTDNAPENTNTFNHTQPSLRQLDIFGFQKQTNWTQGAVLLKLGYHK